MAVAVSLGLHAAVAAWLLADWRGAPAAGGGVPAAALTVEWAPSRGEPDGAEAEMPPAPVLAEAVAPHEAPPPVLLADLAVPSVPAPPVPMPPAPAAPPPPLAMPEPPFVPQQFAMAVPAEAPPPPLPDPAMPAPAQPAASGPPAPSEAEAASPAPPIEQATARLDVLPPPPPMPAEAPPEPRAAPPRPPASAERALRRPRRGIPNAAQQAAAHGATTNAASGPAILETAAAATDGAPILMHAPRYRRPPRPPDYPPRAVDLGLTGTVMVRALVSPDGDTQETRVWRSSGHPLLDAAAIAAVRRWAFEPARTGGRPVPAWVEVPVHFRLN